MAAKSAVTKRARQLRNNPTQAEKLLWSRLQHEQLGVKFRRQHPIKPYYVDFCCLEKKLIVEADGGQHNENRQDPKRTTYLESEGYKVLRFWNNEILKNIEGVLEIIKTELALPPKAPPPIFGRGGKGGREKPFSSYRADFPMLATTMHGRPLAYLDTASSAQKPRAVIGSMTCVAETTYSNVHRGLYEISQNLTQLFERVRSRVARFINAPENTIVFTRNTTEAINLVAQTWGRTFLREGDEVILTEMEHHANIVPWQLLKENNKIKIKVNVINKDCSINLENLKKILSPRTRMICVTQISNAVGTINPVKKIIEITRNFNPEIKVLVDGSQGVVHSPVNVRDLDCDFYVFTGHKLYGPTGVGALYGKYELLESMPPYQGGGDMIERVTFEKTTFKKPPARFEAGTPAIMEVLALGAAINYIDEIGFDRIAAHESQLLEYMLAELRKIDGLTLYGPEENRAGIVSFTMKDAHPSDIAEILDKTGVAVRAGHHCCMPLMQRLGIEATVRASLGLYSNKDDIDQLLESLRKVKELFR